MARIWPEFWSEARFFLVFIGRVEEETVPGQVGLKNTLVREQGQWKARAEQEGEDAD